MTDKADKKGGGLLGSLRNLVFEDEPEKTAAPPAHPVQAAMPGSEPVPQPRPYSPSQTYGASSGVADPAIYATLKKALREAALPAFDAFEKVIAGFANIPGMTDEMKTQAALAAIGAQGQNLGQVLTDISECLDALTKKETEGNNAAEQALKTAVGGREKAAQDMGAQIEAKTQQITQIQREIAELQANQGRATSEIATTRSNIESTQKRFVATVAALRTELQQTREKLAAMRGGVHKEV